MTSVGTSYSVGEFFDICRYRGAARRKAPWAVLALVLSLTLCVSATMSGATPASPWRPYLTSVNPASSVDFVNANLGWRVTGQVFGPHIDDNLATFTGGEVDWPGTSISATRDGGRTWSTVLKVSTGIRGLDFVSPRVGYAVAVTSLRRSTDGGSHWQEVDEPPGQPLVWVNFQSASDGFGVTAPGTLVRSTDGGTVWSMVGLGVVATRGLFCVAAGRLCGRRGRRLVQDLGRGPVLERH